MNATALQGVQGRTRMMVLPLRRSSGPAQGRRRRGSRRFRCACEGAVPHPVDDLHQLTRNGLDDEVDREAVDRASLGRPDHRHQCPARPDDARRAPLDVTADDIEDQVDPADVFEILVVEVEELVRAEVERRLAVRRPAGTDDVGAELWRAGSPQIRPRLRRRVQGRSALPEDDRAGTGLATRSGPRSAGSHPP